MEMQDAEERSKKRGRHWLMIGVIIAVSIILSIMVIIVYELLSRRGLPTRETDVEAGHLSAYAAWLLGQRTPDYGWSDGMTPDAVVALSLGTPGWCCRLSDTRLTAQALHIQLLDLLLRTRNNTLQVSSQLAKYSIAAKVLCMDINDFHGVNLTDIMRSHVLQYKQMSVSSIHMDGYMHSLLGLAVTGGYVSSDELKILMNHQNQDGSFGLPEILPVDSTAQYIQILGVTSVNSRLDVRDINSGINKGLTYLQNCFHEKEQSFGNKSTEGEVLQALYSVGNISDSYKHLRTSLEEKITDNIPKSKPFSSTFECCKVLPALARHSMIDLKRLVACGT